MEVRDTTSGIKSACTVIDRNLHLYTLDVNIVTTNYKIAYINNVDGEIKSFDNVFLNDKNMHNHFYFIHACNHSDVT